MGAANDQARAGLPARRQILRTLALLGAGATLPPDLLRYAAAQTTPSPTEKPFRIDVHFHVVSPAYLKRTARFVDPSRANDRSDTSLTRWTPALAVEEMDKDAIATGLLSIAVGGVTFANDDATRTLVREDNEFAAKAVRDYPGRFGQLAALPLLDLEASLKEIEYALDTLKADGIALVTDYGDKWLGDPMFAPAFEELNRRKAVVFVHPTAPTCCAQLVPKIPESWVEYDFDTSRAFNSMLVNGVFSKYPDLHFIFTHSGGTLPALSGRLERMFPPSVAGDRAPNGVAAEIRKLYFDLSSGAYPAALDALADVIPASQMLFGSDYPFVKVAATIDGLKQYTKFSKSDVEAINRGNALRLFPRLKG
jgi:predicted TIM-barrel fold metal-dependent hydrolase